MACNSRGAPVRLWRPAPHVEKKEPITITHGEGQARVPTTRFPLTASPNLRKEQGKQKQLKNKKKSVSIKITFTIASTFTFQSF